MAYVQTGSNGEIVIQAVLTKVGRKLLSQGKFNPVKFALSDDGIDYTLTTSSIQSLRILQAPIDQTQSMKYKLYTPSIYSTDDGSTSFDV